jgi:biopolymer transport protein ExbB
MTQEAFLHLFEQAKGIWLSGGWGMIALAFNGLVMFGIGMFVLFRLIGGGALSSADQAFRRWQRGKRAAGPLGAVVEEAMKHATLNAMEHFFDALRNDEMSPYDRDLRVLRVSVSTAPLLGLLGTVTGMLVTFGALASGGGGEKTMGMIAGGISEALVTTETGLVLGLAGMMMQFALARQQDGIARKFARVETLCLATLRDESTNGKATA